VPHASTPQVFPILRAASRLTLLVLGAAGCLGDVAATESGQDAGPAPDRDAAASTGTMGSAAGPADASNAQPDATAPRGDAGQVGDASVAPSDAALPPVGVPAGQVAIVTVLGDGAFTMASCDEGRTFHVNGDFSAERADHSAWTAFGGLSFGAGSFVAALGWGSPGHVITSTDGTSWKELPSSAFVRSGGSGGLNEYLAAVVYTGSEHILFNSGMWRSGDANTFTYAARTLPDSAQQIRQVRAFPGLIVAAVETQNGGDHPVGNFVVVSEDGAKTWHEGTGFADACALYIQHGGDIERVGEAIVVGVGDVCRSADRGRTWEHLTLPAGGPIDDFFSDGTTLYALSGNRLFRSTDGRSYAQLGTLPGAGKRGAYVGGAFVVVNGRADHVYRSADGKVWSEVTPQSATGGQEIRDIVVGYGRPSASCTQ
jgi:hypothetical protein